MSDASIPAASSSRRPPLGAALHRPQITAALHRALTEEWARVGYAALSLEAVARRAGVGKAALYRRWPSKQAMVAESFGAFPSVPIALPDRGSFAADLAAALRELRRLLRHPLVRRILLDLHAEMPRSPDLDRLVRERIHVPRRALVAEMVQRAIIRRELPARCDPDLAADMIVAPLYWRLMVTGGRADDDYLDELAATVTVALGAER